jgi:hypothetical protein
MDDLQYTTLEGQRWDTIANLAYGNPGLAKKIIEANPNVPVTDVLPAGVILNIPTSEEAEVLTDLTLLPPWKR